jgi:hypothetical protein
VRQNVSPDCFAPVSDSLTPKASGIYAVYRQAVPLTVDSVTADPSTIFFILSLVTTVLTTLLIVFRIATLGLFTKDSPYRNIIEIVVESAALYSIILILFIPLYVQTDIRLNFMSEYLKRVMIGMTVRVLDYPRPLREADMASSILQGIAPTLIVHRVASGTSRSRQDWGRTRSSMTFASAAPTAPFSTVGPTITGVDGEVGDYQMSKLSVNQDTYHSRMDIGV